MKKTWIVIGLIALAIALYLWIKRKGGWSKLTGDKGSPVNININTGTSQQETSAQGTGKSNPVFKSGVPYTPPPGGRVKPKAKVE